MPAHRLAWIFAHGPIPDRLWVLHKCDHPKCVNPNHLFTGTPKDNAVDRESKGRGRSGPNGPWAQYTRTAAERKAAEGRIPIENVRAG